MSDIILEHPFVESSESALSTEISRIDTALSDLLAYDLTPSARELVMQTRGRVGRVRERAAKLSKLNLQLAILAR